jgi:hypothetical protein
MLLGSGERQAPSGIRAEIAKIPTFNEAPERRDSRMLL